MQGRALPFEQSSLARRAGTVGLHRIPNNGTAIFTETYWPPTSACYSLSYNVLQRGPCCLLATSSISPRDPHLPRLLVDLKSLLSTHPWAHALLNYFENVPDPRSLAKAAATAHPRIGSAFVPGFKTLFWQKALTTRIVGAFSHLFIFDSDMVIRPSDFDLVTLLRIGEVVNASIVQPSPFGSHAGMYMLGMPRCPESDACKCSPKPWEQCLACRQPVIEVKVPLFTRDAWLTIHEHLFRKIPSAALTADKMIDLTWCGLLDHKLRGGCAPSEDPGKAKPECTHDMGGACAVSYATPIRHLNHRTIERIMLMCRQERRPSAALVQSLDYWIRCRS